MSPTGAMIFFLAQRKVSDASNDRPIFFEERFARHGAFRHNSLGTRSCFPRTKKYIIEWVFSQWRVADDPKRGNKQHLDFLAAAYEGKEISSRESARFVSEDETNHIEQLLRERLKRTTADQLRPWLVKAENIPPALQKVITIVRQSAGHTEGPEVTCRFACLIYADASHARRRFYFVDSQNLPPTANLPVL